MCIHFFEAKYTCGCRRTLPTYGPGYQPPWPCNALKRAHRRYHAQPRYPPLQQPLPAPKACPPIINTTATKPGNVAILECKEVCPIHANLAHLCQISSEQRTTSYHDALTSNPNTTEQSFPIISWREITGNQTSIGEFQGEDGPFKGVERYEINSQPTLPAPENATTSKHHQLAHTRQNHEHYKHHKQKTPAPVVSSSSSSSCASSGAFCSGDAEIVQLARLYYSQPVHRLQPNVARRRTKSV